MGLVPLIDDLRIGGSDHTHKTAHYSDLTAAPSSGNSGGRLQSITGRANAMAELRDGPSSTQRRGRASTARSRRRTCAARRRGDGRKRGVVFRWPAPVPALALPERQDEEQTPLTLISPRLPRNLRATSISTKCR